MDMHTQFYLSVDAATVMPCGLKTKWPSSEFYFWDEYWTDCVLHTELWMFFKAVL